MNYDIVALLKYIGNDIAETMAYLPIGIGTFLFVMVCRKLLSYVHGENRIRAGRRRSPGYPALLAAYCVIILFITFLSRDPGARNGMDLMPFATIGNSIQGDAYVVENVLLFIPLGMLLPLAAAWERRFWRCAGTGMMLSLLIEASQFLTKRGYVQTDDVLTNILGTMIGYALFAIASTLWGKRIH